MSGIGIVIRSLVVSEPTPERGHDEHTIEHPRLTWEDLSTRIKGRTGATADAADSFSDAVMNLLDALHEDVTPNTGRPGEVVETIDEALGVLHTIRTEAVQESRRRMDAAMESSAKTLGKGDDR